MESTRYSHLVLSVLGTLATLMASRLYFFFSVVMSQFHQLHSSYFMYLIHPSSPWSSSSPPSLPTPHASIIPLSNPSDRISCPKNRSFLLIAVCCNISSSSTPISNRTLSLVFFSVHDILCIFLHIHISHALIFFHLLWHCPRLTSI